MWIYSARPYFVCALAAATLLLPTPSPATGQIVQHVDVSYDSDPNTPGEDAFDGDEVRIPPDPALRDVSAQITGFYGSAFAAAGLFGDVGMQGEVHRSGQMRTVAFIENDTFVNLLGVPQFARTNFIIDGGQILLLGGPVATIQYSIDIGFFIYDSAGGVVDVGRWQSAGIVESRDFNRPTLTVFGEDIGVALVPNSIIVDIPLSFHTFDIGIIPPGGSIDLTYQADFRSDTQLVEIAAWRFSDPGNITGAGDFPTVTFSPAAVPEPGAALAIGVGLAVAAWKACRRRARRSTV
jgi:hypothetical protein